MARFKPAKPLAIYQLKVTLNYSDPPIWRRLQVESHITLARLHYILQLVMGWDNDHLHEYRIRGTRFREQSSDRNAFGTPTEDENRFRLEQVISRAGAKFEYEYDFGDCWEHEILVEEILPPEEGVRYPVCLAGARACPPEDCGGIGGYANLLQAINDPKHPEHEDQLEWLGEGFDPEEFDPEKINARLRALR